MRRRDLLAALLAGAAIARPQQGITQSGDRIRRIGVLQAFALGDPERERRVAAFEQALEELGWTKGRNLEIDYRSFRGDAKLALALARELAGLAPDMLVGEGSPAVVALRQASDALPILFVMVADPVGQGFVASLAHPGGNVTGFSNYEPGMAGKWLEMLKEVRPGLARVAFLFNPTSAPVGALFLSSLRAAGRSVGVEAIASPVHDDAEVERVLSSLGSAADVGLVIMPEPFTATHRKAIIELAARYRVPAVYPFRYDAAGGGLLSYGVDASNLYRRAASYVDRILRGAKPAELPVQQPIKFDLVINLKTAKALGLTIPPLLFARADEVIE